MRKSSFLSVFMVTLCVVCVRAQDKRPTAPPGDSGVDRSLLSNRSDSLGHFTTIITKIPFEGTNYFIKIVPLDSSNIDHMPMYDPERGGVIFWKDSLRRLLPDTVLRLVPKGRHFK